MSSLPAHPFVDWAYNNPSWLVSLVIVLAIVGFSLAGLVIAHYRLGLSARQAHNDLSAAVSTIVGTVVAVLLAFISVASWETFSRDQDIANSESAAVTNLYLDTVDIGSETIRASVQGHLQRYVGFVIDTEWPAQREGRLGGAAFAPGRNELYAINRDLAAMNPQTFGGGNVQSQLMTSLNQLFTDRRQRRLAVDEHVNNDVWGVILAGTALAIASTWLFGPRNLRMHMVLTGSVATSMALVIVMIVMTDYPFRGAVSISPESYEASRDSIKESMALQSPAEAIDAGDTVPRPSGSKLIRAHSANFVTRNSSLRSCARSSRSKRCAPV